MRRTTAVLFDVTGTNTKLTSGFDDASTDAAAVAFARTTLIESDLSLAPFAIVQWSHDLELLVFGDLSLHSSVPSARMITGAASETWVEHRIDRRLLSAQPPLQVWSGEAPEPGTNLRLGIAVSSGFRLNLVVGTDPQAEPEPAIAPSRATVEQPAVLPEPEPVLEAAPVAEAAPASEPEPVVQAAPGVEPAVEQLDHDDTDADPFAVSTPAAAVAPQGASALLEFDPFEPSAAPAPVATPPAPEAASIITTWVDDTPDPTTPDSTTPEPSDAASDSEASAAPRSASATAEVAAAEPSNPEVLCVHGHSNPVDSASCFTCGASIVTASAAGGSLPGVGRLVFDLRDDVVITGAATIGRKPAADGHAELIVIDHPEVSRSHAAISIDGWAVTLTDLESRNGTWVHPPTDEGLRRLDPGERVVLVDGTIVHLGSVDVCFTWIAGTDV